MIHPSHHGNVLGKYHGHMYNVPCVIMTLFKSITMLCYVGLIVFHKLFTVFSMNMIILHGILSVPHNIVTDMDNVMIRHHAWKHRATLHWI